MQSLYGNPDNSASLHLTLSKPVARFLREVPTGVTFTLWNLQGALRFTHTEIPAAQTLETELRAAQAMGLIREITEDMDTTARYQRRYGRNVRYGQTFEKLSARTRA